MRFLVVGLGGIGQRHVRNLRALLGARARISVYRVRNEATVLTDTLGVEAGVSLEDKYDINVVPDLRVGLLERPDAVLVCNPSSLHLSTALEAASAGCNLFIEKPLSHSPDGADELVRLVEAKRLVGLVGYQLRFHPCLVRAKELLESAAIGRVVAARVGIGEYLPGWHTYEDYRRMYASRSDLGGGVVLSQIHELDYVFWLFGMPKRVFALGGHLTNLEIDVEDVASSLLECTVSGRAIPIHVHQDFIQRPPRRTLEIIGEAGRIDIDLREHSLTMYNAEGDVVEQITLPAFERNQLFLDEMRHFLDCLAGRAQPTVSVRDGLESLRIASAILSSIRSGAAVDLEAASA